jgi:hypothetical protein
MFKKLAFFSSLLILLTACSTSYDAGVVYHGSFDFSTIQNYSLYDRNSEFTEAQSLIDSRRNAIEIAIERTMAKQQFNYVPVEQADIIVSYYVVKGSKADYFSYNKLVGFCQHCLRSSSWNTENIFPNITRGSLILDLISPTKKRSIWRSAYPLDLKDDDNSATTNNKIKHAVVSMLAKYPNASNKAKTN